jgi:hypothetical protein
MSCHCSQSRTSAGERPRTCGNAALTTSARFCNSCCAQSMHDAASHPRHDHSHTRVTSSERASHLVDDRAPTRPRDRVDVDSTIECVLTRFVLRSPSDLVRTARDYRRVMRSTLEIRPRGFLASSFLVENASTCWSLSLWSDPAALGVFGASVVDHVVAGNNLMPRLARDDGGAPMLWSTRWRLASISNNLNWGSGFDLRATLTQAGVLPEAEP